MLFLLLLCSIIKQPSASVKPMNHCLKLLFNELKMSIYFLIFSFFFGEFLFILNAGDKAKEIR